MVNKLVWNTRIQPKILKQAQTGLIDATNSMFNRSQTYTPLDDGELVAGSRISSEGRGTNFFTACISYGNNETSKDYALRQHEDLSYAHTNPEQAKYLETAFNEEADMVLYRVLNRIRM